jgi:hypothetical protein
MPRRALHLLRSRIAFKLTLTLVAFVAISTLVAGLYLRGLEHVAVESVEASRHGVRCSAGPRGAGATRPFCRRWPAAAARVTLIAGRARCRGSDESEAWRDGITQAGQRSALRAGDPVAIRLPPRSGPADHVAAGYDAGRVASSASAPVRPRRRFGPRAAMVPGRDRAWRAGTGLFVAGRHAPWSRCRP